MILDVAAAGRAGFGRFVFKHAPEHLDALTASSGHEAGKHVLRFAQDARLHDYYLELIPVAVDELMESEGLELARIQAILPPQISSEFVARLGERLGVDSLRMVDAVGQGPDLFTSSLPYALDRLREPPVGCPRRYWVDHPCWFRDPSGLCDLLLLIARLWIGTTNGA